MDTADVEYKKPAKSAIRAAYVSLISYFGHVRLTRYFSVPCTKRGFA